MARNMGRVVFVGGDLGEMKDAFSLDGVGAFASGEAASHVFTRQTGVET